MEFTFSLFAPYKNVSALDVSSVAFCTPDGPIQIFKSHAPLISELKSDRVVVKLVNGSARTFNVTKGLASVTPDGVQIYATEYSEE